MAQPDLTDPVEWRRLIPAVAARALADGDDGQALTALRRARDAQAPGSVAWAVLERLTGLLLIHRLREVEGTFALERADPVLDAAGVALPTLLWLEDLA